MGVLPPSSLFAALLSRVEEDTIAASSGLSAVRSRLHHGYRNQQIRRFRQILSEKPAKKRRERNAVRFSGRSLLRIYDCTIARCMPIQMCAGDRPRDPSQQTDAGGRRRKDDPTTFLHRGTYNCQCYREIFVGRRCALYLLSLSAVKIVRR